MIVRIVVVFIGFIKIISGSGLMEIVALYRRDHQESWESFNSLNVKFIGNRSIVQVEHLHCRDLRDWNLLFDAIDQRFSENRVLISLQAPISEGTIEQIVGNRRVKRLFDIEFVCCWGDFNEYKENRLVPLNGFQNLRKLGKRWNVRQLHIEENRVVQMIDKDGKIIKEAGKFQTLLDSRNMSADVDFVYLNPSMKDSEKANVEFLHIGEKANNQLIKGSMFRLENPINHFSIFPPEGGCQKDSRTKTSVTAKQHNCIAASNAGYFDVNTGTCLGNLVSNGTFIQGSRLRNPTFGVTKSGKAIIGYLGDALNTNDFQGEEILSLVQGIIWIVRNGKNNVDEALKVESSEAQSTGDFSYFARVKSARTALGIDTHGNIITVTVEGKTGIEGIDLYQLADLLINVGVVSAINLDGGGSAQAVLKGELVTFPSDECPDHAKSFEYCERIITSITCMHDFNIQRKNNDTDPKKTDFFDKDSNQYSGKLILAIAFGTIFGATICVFLIRYLVHKCRAISLEKHYLNEEDQHSLETLSEDLKGKPLTLDSDGADVDLEPGSN